MKCVEMLSKTGLFTEKVENISINEEILYGGFCCTDCYEEIEVEEGWNNSCGCDQRPTNCINLNRLTLLHFIGELDKLGTPYRIEHETDLYNNNIFYRNWCTTNRFKLIEECVLELYMYNVHNKLWADNKWRVK